MGKLQANLTFSSMGENTKTKFQNKNIARKLKIGVFTVYTVITVFTVFNGILLYFTILLRINSRYDFKHLLRGQTTKYKI